MQVNGNNISEKNKPLTSTTIKGKKLGTETWTWRNVVATSVVAATKQPYVTRKLVVIISLLFSDDEKFSGSEKLCSLFRVFLENKENKPELLWKTSWPIAWPKFVVRQLQQQSYYTSHLTNLHFLSSFIIFYYHSHPPHFVLINVSRNSQVVILTLYNSL